MALCIEGNLLAQSSSRNEYNQFLIKIESFINRHKIEVDNRFVIMKLADSVSFYPKDLNCLLKEQIVKLAKGSPVIADSMAYEVAVFSVPIVDTLILSFADSWKISIDTTVSFPNMGTYGEFHGGMRNFNTMLAKYLTQNRELIPDSVLRFSIVFDNSHYSKLLYILGGSQSLRDSLFSFWGTYKFKHYPATLYGRLWNQIYHFQASQDSVNTIAVECTETNIIAGLAISNEAVYGILERKPSDYLIQLVYDPKNSVDKIYQDNHIDRLLMKDRKAVLSALRHMHEQRFLDGLVYPMGTYYVSKYLVNQGNY